MSQFTILVVEDEQAIRSMLVMVLQQYDFNVLEAADVMQAQTILDETLPDLILLDWMLPRITGDEWTRRLKSNPSYRDLPVILVTAKGEEADKIRGLDIGADDYVTKPFSPKELIARIKAVLRRTLPLGIDESIEVDGLILDPVCHRVTSHQTIIEIAPTEYRLLQFFMTHQERVYSRSQLLDQVWGGNVYVEERTVDVHIRRLRKSLGKDHEHLIKTVRGSGYRFTGKAA